MRGRVMGMAGLLARGLDLTAVHNHLNDMSPHVMYMHFRDIGGGVFQVAVPRAEAITSMGQPLLPAMGVVTVMNFQTTAAAL